MKRSRFREEQIIAVLKEECQTTGCNLCGSRMTPQSGQF
jgi:hypothetical protein